MAIVPGTFRQEDGEKQTVILPGKIQTRIVNVDLKSAEAQASPETLHPAGCDKDIKNGRNPSPVGCLHTQFLTAVLCWMPRTYVLVLS
jgi:hypothetical protein